MLVEDGRTSIADKLAGDECPDCSAKNNSKVLETRAPRRRRKCLKCRNKFTTYEIREDSLERLTHTRDELEFMIERIANMQSALKRLEDELRSFSTKNL